MRDVEEATSWFCPRCREMRTLLWALEASPCGQKDCPLPVEIEALQRPSEGNDG